MDPVTISSLVRLGTSLIQKIWPDPAKQAEELRKLKELEQTGDIAQLNAFVQLMLAQIEVNKIQAQHKSLFVAGPRPFVLWVGGVALAWQFVLYPMLLWFWAFWQSKGYVPADMLPPPVLDSSELMALVSALLGVAGMRSFDKSRGVQTDRIS